jgi:hypothetical protein
MRRLAVNVGGVAFSLSFRGGAMFNLCPFEVEAISQMPAAASGDGAREEQNYE